MRQPVRGERRHDQRGTITLWLVGFAMAMVALIGLVVDGGGKVWTQQRAQDLAAQAARVGGQHIQPDLAIHGEAARVDPGAARAATRAYLAAAGVSGTVTINGQDTITVQVIDHYRPVILSLFGIGETTVTATATARLNRVVEGTPR